MLRIKLEDFFRSGHNFRGVHDAYKDKFFMLNLMIVLLSIGLFVGAIFHLSRAIYTMALLEVLLLSVCILFLFLLRKRRASFLLISTIITAQYSLFLICLLCIHQGSDLNHILLFIYPLLLLYLQDSKNALYWMGFMVSMLLILPFQNVFETHYSLVQVLELIFVLLSIGGIVYFYKIKMDVARAFILKQKYELENFNMQLEAKVKEKTLQLQDFNDSLELKVQEKVQELISKDELLSIQSKQAVMGEMISMIAHQWRQPLSTITLQISNLHFKRLLGEDVSIEENDKTLREISDAIMYLSETIDDFQTYFRPTREQETKEVHALFERAIKFVRPRINELDIEIINQKENDIFIQTYDNEMVQVILNLLNNSIDAFIERKKENAKLYLYADETEEKVCIYVKDNAGGIPKETLTRLFEPYFSTKGKNGTGLGLYMSKMIVQKQFGGEIRVESDNGETIFIVEIRKLLS